MGNCQGLGGGRNGSHWPRGTRVSDAGELRASSVQCVVAVSAVRLHANIFAKGVHVTSNALITKNKITKEGSRELLEAMFMA